MTQKKVTIEELKRRLYLYERTEVILTGRTAVKQTGRRRSILFEIRPHNPNEAQFKKWVRLTDLYEIQHGEKTFHPPEELINAVRRVVEQKRKEEGNTSE